MKRKIRLSIALVLTIGLVFLTNGDSPVEAQNQVRYTAGTGMVALTPGENLNLTINGTGDEPIIVRFRRTRYVRTNCDDGICRYVVASQTTTPAMLSAPNQSSKLDFMGSQLGPNEAGSIEVLSSSRNARVTAQLSDAVTGQTQSVLIALLIP